VAKQRKNRDEAESPAFICPHVFHRTKPVLLVCHETDGDWQFLCGGNDHTGDDGHVVGRGHLPEHDPTLREVLDLPKGHCAERRKIGAEWVRTSQEAS
jgi:hypothetical protein